MKFEHLALSLSILVSLSGCSRSPEAAAPAASAAPEAPATEAAKEDSRDRPGEGAAEPAPPPAPAAAPEPLDRAPARAEARSSDALDDEFRTLADAERALAQAKADLDRLALAQPAPSAGRSKGSAEKKAEAAAGSAGPSAVCENTCKAFSSLSRAASAVCRLDGSSGSHCTKAKRVVADSQARVASCSCGGD